MEGRGVTNYAVDKPSYAFSTSTTEFDDALMQRGIVTLEQAMAAKGASPEEAQRLAQIKTAKEVETPDAIQAISSDKDDESDGDESDDDFLEKYRAMRLSQLRQEKDSNYFGQIMSISRPEWQRHVNEASEEAWVVVTLTASTHLTGGVEAACRDLATKFPLVKFVKIPSLQAIATWPDSNLPTLFLYRHGKLQHKLIQMQTAMSAERLEWELAQLQVLETDLEEEPPIKESPTVNARKYGIFGGTMAQLATKGGSDDDSDFDSDA